MKGRPKTHTANIDNGLPVVDATESLILRVSGTDIRRGVQNDAHACAAACSAKRQMGADFVTFLKGTALVQLAGDNFLTRFRIHKEFTPSFDNGKAQPGIIKLHAPSKSQTLAYKRSKPRSDTGTGRKQGPRGAAASFRGGAAHGAYSRV